MANKFCIIATPRTGSNWLCGILNKVPYVVCHYEVFHHRELYSHFHVSSGKRKLGTPAYQLAKLNRDLFPLRFLDTLIRRSEDEFPGTLATGFKLFPEHNQRIYRHVCRSSDWKVIFLTRRNRLAQYSSFKIAKTSGRWVVINDSQVETSQRKVVFDPNEFDRYALTQNQSDAAIMHDIDPARSMSLDYLEILDRLPDILGFIDERLATQELNVGITRKENSSDLLERFENPEEVLRHLSPLQKSEFLGVAG